MGVLMGSLNSSKYSVMSLFAGPLTHPAFRNFIIIHSTMRYSRLSMVQSKVFPATTATQPLPAIKI